MQTKIETVKMIKCGKCEMKVVPNDKDRCPVCGTRLDIYKEQLS